MGSPARVVTDSDEATAAAMARIVELEDRWSRFLPTSEVSRANVNAGFPTVVSNDTLILAQRCAYAAARTNGLFNPLLLRHLEALGYDQTFDSITPTNAGPVAPAPSAGWTSASTLTVLTEASAIIVPTGTGLDPGGLGKGLAGDLAADAALAAGAQTVLIEVGGDIRVAGEPWNGETWQITMGHGTDRSVGIGTVEIDTGGVATSSTQRLRWMSNDSEVHHILDGRTGRPAATDVLAATVTAGELWWAEVGATCAILSGRAGAARLLESLDMHGCLSLEADAA